MDRHEFGECWVVPKFLESVSMILHRMSRCSTTQKLSSDMTVSSSRELRHMLVILSRNHHESQRGEVML